MLDPIIAIMFAVFGFYDMSTNYCGTAGGCLAYQEAQQRLSISGGAVVFDGEHISEEAYLKYEFGQTRGPFQPTVGVAITGDGDTWAGVGASYTKQWDHFYVQLSGSAGLHFTQNGPDIGSTVEFRSEAEIGYEWDNGIRLGMFVDHRSNAGLSATNPGLETIQVRLSFPLGNKRVR